MVSCARSKIDEEIVLYANTILVHAENFMPKALGEFGLAKNSDVTHKVLSVITDADGPITIKQIWRSVHTDLENISKLVEILKNLAEADKVQAIPSKSSGH
jgi:phage FluMu protein gp41